MSRMRWDPNGDGTPIVLQDDEEDPKGFLDHHPDDMAKGGAAGDGKARPEAEEPMTRDEVVKALQTSGVPFKEEATDKQLHDQLVALLRKALTENKVDFTKRDGPRALLALLNEHVVKKA